MSRALNEEESFRRLSRVLAASADVGKADGMSEVDGNGSRTRKQSLPRPINVSTAGIMSQQLRFAAVRVAVNVAAISFHSHRLIRLPLIRRAV